MKKFIPLFLILGLSFSSTSALAYERGLVKGDTSFIAIPNFNLSEGPGFLLPSSPLYSLDLIKNSLRVNLASSERVKIQKRLQVAAERLVELKILMESNNPSGFDAAVSSLIEQLDGVRASFVKGGIEGDVSKVAGETYNKLNVMDDALKSLMAVSEDVTKKKLEAVSISLSQTKDSVISNLPGETKSKEKIKKLTREASENASNAEKDASDVSEKIKEAVAEISSALKVNLGGTEDNLSESEALLPLQQSVDQADKSLGEVSNTKRNMERWKNFDVDKFWKEWSEATRPAVIRGVVPMIRYSTENGRSGSTNIQQSPLPVSSPSLGNNE